MRFFFYKLIPPRPTFMADMTPAELAIMRDHSMYWRENMAAGKVVAIGPVADPSGGYGVGIIRLDDAESPQALGENDPAIRANAGFRFEFHPMPTVVVAGT